MTAMLKARIDEGKTGHIDVVDPPTDNENTSIECA